jgi:hypothetical protein
MKPQKPQGIMSPTAGLLSTALPTAKSKKGKPEKNKSPKSIKAMTGKMSQMGSKSKAKESGKASYKGRRLPVSRSSQESDAQHSYRNLRRQAQ